MLVNHTWWLLGHVWDLMLMFVAPKRIEYSLYCYHFQDQMSSSTLTPPFFIDAIETRWKHNDTLNVNRFYGFLHCRCAPIDIPRYRPRIAYFQVSWTQPTLSSTTSSYSCQRLLFLPSCIHHLQTMQCPLLDLTLHLKILRSFPLL